MKLETKLQCPNCKAKFVLSREVDSMSREVYSDFSDDYAHRLASSYVPLECFLLLCQVANLKATEERAFRWLCEYRIEFGDRIRRVLATLTPREEKVLRMRFGVGEKQDYTLEEVGKVLGVTRERVRQIEAKAIMRLRHPTRLKMLKDLIERIRKAKGTFPLFLLKPI